MSYASATLPAIKQLKTGYETLDKSLRIVTTALWLVLQLPIHAIKIFPPVLLIAVSAAYASAQFAAHRDVFPFPLNWAQAIAYEWVTLGTLAMASVKRGKQFYIVLGCSAVTAVMYILMYTASKYGMLSQIKAVLPTSAAPYLELLITIVLILVHALPLTVVNLVYMFLVHTHLGELAARIYCKHGCGYWSVNEHMVRGHLAQCVNRPSKDT